MRNSEIRARARTEAGHHFLPLCLLLVLIPALGWLWTLQLAIVMPPWAMLAPLIPVACYFFASPVGLYYLEKDRIPVGEVWHHFVTSGRLGVLSNLLLELLWRFTVYLLIAIATSFFRARKTIGIDRNKWPLRGHPAYPPHLCHCIAGDGLFFFSLFIRVFYRFFDTTQCEGGDGGNGSILSPDMPAFAQFASQLYWLGHSLPAIRRRRPYLGFAL